MLRYLGRPHYREFQRIPFVGIGNTLRSNDAVWKNIYKKVEESLKAWKFKPSLWELEDKKVEIELNSRMATRPHGGFRFFLILFTVNSDIEHNPIYTDIFNLYLAKLPDE